MCHSRWTLGKTRPLGKMWTLGRTRTLEKKWASSTSHQFCEFAELCPCSQDQTWEARALLRVAHESAFCPTPKL